LLTGNVGKMRLVVKATGSALVPLTLSLSQSPAVLVYQEQCQALKLCGTAVQHGLTSLLALVPMQVYSDTAYEAVRHLSGLSQLQHLVIWAQWDEPTEWYYSTINWSAPPTLPFAGMPWLTQLECNACGLEGLEGLISCHKLQHLSICLTHTHTAATGGLDQHCTLKSADASVPAECQNVRPQRRGL
jgi:hypothetical protein